MAKKVPAPPPKAAPKPPPKPLPPAPTLNPDFEDARNEIDALTRRAAWERSKHDRRLPVDVGELFDVLDELAGVADAMVERAEDNESDANDANDAEAEKAKKDTERAERERDEWEAKVDKLELLVEYMEEELKVLRPPPE